MYFNIHRTHETHCQFAFRRDGLLYEATIVLLHLATRIMTRLKVMSNLNIAERRLPQDGELKLQRQNIDIHALILA